MGWSTERKLLEGGRLTPAAEVRGLVGAALGGSEAGLGVGVISHGVLTRKKFGGNFGEGLAHKIFVNQPAAMASIVGNMLLPDVVGGTTDPVFSEAAGIAKNVPVD